MNFRLVIVDTKDLENEFIDLPKKLYKSDPKYIMALDNDIKEVFDKNKNPYFKKGECIRWLAMDENNQAIGRISAFYTENSLTKFRSGACGFFECIYQQDIANSLFDACKKWLIEKQCTFMDGPINFGERDSFWGLMVSGFESPSYRENYNFPYYQQLFENFGFISKIDQTTSMIDDKTFNFDRFSKLASRVFNNPTYTFQHIQKNNLEKFAIDFIEIYNKAWSFHENFEPMTLDKIMGHLKLMKPIIVENLNWFCYANGKPIGFYITVMDVNQIFKHVNGKMNLLGKLKFLYYKRFIQRVKGIVFGVVPEYHNLGVEVALIMKFREGLIEGKKFHENELAWVGDFNPKMLSMFESMGAREYKKHKTYTLKF